MFSGMWIFSFVIPLVVTGVILFFVFRMIGGLNKQARAEQQLLQTGAPANGQIMAVQQTGMMVNNQPQVNIVVMVYPQGGQPYQATLTKIISMFAASQYQIGAQVHVRYDPQNPQRIAIATQQQVMAANPHMMMQQPGMPMQQPGMPMQQPGMPMQQPGMPMQQPGMQQPGMQQPGMQQPGMPPGGYPPAGGGGYPPAGGQGGPPPNFGA